MIGLGLRLSRPRMRSVSAVAWDVIGRLNAIEIDAMPPVLDVTPPVATGGTNQITITG